MEGPPGLPGLSDGLAPQALYIGFVAVGGLVIIGGSLGRPLKDYLLLSPALQATALGLAVGVPAGEFIPSVEFDVLIPKVLAEIVRVVIAVQLMATALALPRRYLRRHWRPLLVQLMPIGLAMWVVSAALVLATVPSVGVWEAFVIGACFAPTDPVLAASVLRGRVAEERIPLHLRDLLMAESGLNDGTAYPLVYLGIFFLKLPAGTAVARWFYDIWAYGVLLSIVLGAALGWAALQLLLWSEKRELYDRQSYLAFSVVLSIGLLGFAELLRTNPFLMIFLASVVLSNHERTEDRNTEAKVQDAADILSLAAFFLAFGATLPWETWGELGAWRLVVLSFALFFLRRLPAALLFKPLVRDYRTWAEAAFAGVFGPIGTAAVLYGILAYEATSNILILGVVEFVVLMNVALFSIAGPLGSRLLAKAEARRHAAELAAAAAAGQPPASVHRSREDDKPPSESDEPASSSAGGSDGSGPTSTDTMGSSPSSRSPSATGAADAARGGQAIADHLV